MENRGRGALGLGQVDVAARARQTVGFTADRAAHHLDRQGEVVGEPAHDRELLVVLLPEVRVTGPDDPEELGDDRGDTGEVRGPTRPFEPLAGSGNRDGGANRGRVHLVDARVEHQVGTRSASERQVAVQIPRVGGEVLFGRELQRVHEDAHDRGVAPHRRRGDERRVALVQIAHRRHEPDGAPSRADRVQAGAQRGDRGDDLDGRSLVDRVRVRHRGDPSSRPVAHTSTSQAGGEPPSEGPASRQAAAAIAAYAGRSSGASAAR